MKTTTSGDFFALYGSVLAQLDALPRDRLTIADLDGAAAINTGLRQRLGVYAIWEGDRFLYVGVVVTVPDEPEARLFYANTPEVLVLNPRARGLYGRLRTHAEGGATDRLWLPYVEQRVIPHLTAEQAARFERREATLQGLIRELIGQGRFQYRAAAVPTPGDARAIEAGIRRHGLPLAGLPELNRISGPSL